MTRQQALDQAKKAAERAADLAQRAEDNVRGYHQAGHLLSERFADAGRAWAEASRAFTELSRELPS